MLSGKVLEPFCPRSPALVTTVRGQCLGDGEGDMLALQSTVPKCLSWIFSPLSPG